MAINPFFGILSDAQIFQTLQILRRQHIFAQVSILKNLSKFSLFFSKLINYKCVFFFNLMQIEPLKNGEISVAYVNKNLHENVQVPLINSLCYLNLPLGKRLYNYYMSDVYSLNSKTMMLCARKTRRAFFNNNY